MNIIKQGDNRVVKIIHKKKLSKEAEYRLSLYSFLYSENGRYLISNTMSFEVTELTEREWKDIQQIKNAPVSFDFLAEKGLEQLAESRYIVETTYNEAEQYQQTVFILKTMAGTKEDIESYIIFPTTGCNARCVYCYEEGYAVKNMTAETAARLVDYICETRHNDTVALRWFGGEPLVRADIISMICTGLRERGVPYKSSMITNASLMTRKLAREAKELWNLKKVQVSLDGVRADYTVRKNYYAPEKHNYDVVMQAVHYLSDEGIKVNLRVNVDTDNIRRIPDFLREIKAEFGDMENISLYLSELFQVQHSDRCLEVYKEIIRMTELQNELGIPVSKKSEHKAVRIRTNYCMADSGGRSVVITPDGIFNNCEHLPEGHSWGNIRDGVTDKAKYDELTAMPALDGQCAKCPFLPECTPFYKTGCPGWFEKCYEHKCIKKEYDLHSLLKGANTEQKDEQYDDEEV